MFFCRAATPCNPTSVAIGAPCGGSQEPEIPGRSTKERRDLPRFQPTSSCRSHKGGRPRMKKGRRTMAAGESRSGPQSGQTAARPRSPFLPDHGDGCYHHRTASFPLTAPRRLRIVAADATTSTAGREDLASAYLILRAACCRDGGSCGRQARRRDHTNGRYPRCNRRRATPRLGLRCPPHRLHVFWFRADGGNMPGGRGLPSVPGSNFESPPVPH